jgi:hypothetical protein
LDEVVEVAERWGAFAADVVPAFVRANCTDVQDCKVAEVAYMLYTFIRNIIRFNLQSPESH